MCKAYKIDYSVFNGMIRCDWTQEKALTIKIYDNSRYRVKDHLGNDFDSKEDMCKVYNIDYDTYNSKIGHGWTQYW